MTISSHVTHRDVVTVVGPDAVTFLHGQLSQDIAGLDVGRTALSFVLAPQGKVDGWGRVLRVDDETVAIDVDPGAGSAWAARLNRFLLRTKATVTVDESVPMLAVRGGEVDGGLDPHWPGTSGGDLFGDAIAA